MSEYHFNTEQKFYKPPYQVTFTQECGVGDIYTMEAICEPVVFKNEAGYGISAPIETVRPQKRFKMQERHNNLGGSKWEFEEIVEKKNETPQKPPKGYKIDPKYIEIKSKRFNALLKPSLFERLKRAAGQSGLSVNELINWTLEAAFPEGK